MDIFHKYYVYTSLIFRYDQEGNEVEMPVFPFMVKLIPTGEVNFKQEESSLEEFSKQWETIPNGAAIYKFMAHSGPEDNEGIELGKIIAVDGCTTSKFGDEHLFFQHQRIEDDIILKPEWESSYLTEC